MEPPVDRYNVEPPVDRYNLVYFICSWLGIGMLFPWNFFLAADGYWRHKFRNTENATGNATEEVTDMHVFWNATEEVTDMQVFWGSSLSLVSMGTNFFFLFLNAAFGHKFRIQPRLYGSITFNIILFIITVIFTQINTDSWQVGFFSLTLITALLFNMNDSIFGGGFTSLMGRFPISYISALSQGMALGGTISATIAVIFLAIGGSDVNAALFSFIFAAAFLTSMTILLYVVSKQEFFQFYAPNEESIKEGTEGKKVNFRLVIRETWVFNVAIFINFWVTLGVFPAVPILVESTSDYETWRTYFHPVGLFLVFNACDLIGRFAHTIIKRPQPNKFGSFVSLGAAVARIAFIPLFMFCNARPHDRINSKVLFESDVAFVIINILFGVSNGYIANCCMTCSPKMVKEPENQGVAGSIMMSTLTFGLFIGACSSFLWVALL